MTGSSLAVSVLGRLTLYVVFSMTDCWMRHLPRKLVHGARSFGVACPCNLSTPVLRMINSRSGRLHVEFLVGLKRIWDQKLSSGLLLTFMTTHIFQFRFADAEQYWLITLTFLMSQRILRHAVN